MAAKLVPALVFVLVVAPAYGQDRPPHPGWDVAALGGFLAGRVDPPAEGPYSNDWYHAGQFGVIVSRYWTAHVKSEVGVNLAGEDSRWVQRSTTIPGVDRPVYFFADENLQLNALTGSMAWQFFENQWVHPYVLAGVTVDRERRRTHTREQRYYASDPRGTPGILITPEFTSPVETTTELHALGGGGAKLYVAPRAFFVTEMRVAFDAGTKQLMFRGGFGFDF